MSDSKVPVEPLIENQPCAKEPCEHYWCWTSPAGTSKSARICMTCNDPDPEWLDTIEELKDGEDICYSDEKTLNIVEKTIENVLNESLRTFAKQVTNNQPLTFASALDFVIALQKEGIIFRERRRE